MTMREGIKREAVHLAKHGLLEFIDPETGDVLDPSLVGDTLDLAKIDMRLTDRGVEYKHRTDLGEEPGLAEDECATTEREYEERFARDGSGPLYDNSAESDE